MAALNQAAVASRGDGFRPRRGSTVRKQGLGLLLVCGQLSLGLSPVQGASNKVRISNLTDVAFGTLGNLSTDAVQSQSLCLYADTAANGYNVTAAGSGPGNSFELAAGSQSLGYEVQWSGSSNQTSGTKLEPNVPLGGQTSTGAQQTCNNGPASTASLIVILRSAALSSASAGGYSGSLTLLVGPE